MKILQGIHWTGGLLIFMTPVLLVFLLGSQMAYSQVRSQYRAYQAIPEAETLAGLESLPDGSVVMVRGQIAPDSAPAGGSGLVVYQVYPAEGREPRYKEEFPLVFPAFTMALPDGRLDIIPSDRRELVIRDGQRTEPAGDYRWVGFAPGDTVMVQGQWQKSTGTLVEVTGITGGDRASLMAEWERAFRIVGWVRNGLTLLTLAGVVLLVIQWRRTRKQTDEETEQWENPNAETVPTTSHT
ncbi:MAG: hypothetical protein D6784_07760 [Chloroflexi bacterium]|nr:MAG: hypothetical protein D6784_07760 [Chloroflexota bacterium]